MLEHLSFFCIYYENLFLSIFLIRALWRPICDGRGRSGSVSCSGEQPMGDQGKSKSKTPHIILYLELSFLTLTFWLTDIHNLNKELIFEYLKVYPPKNSNLFLDIADTLPPRCGQGCLDDQRATYWTRGRYQWAARALCIWGN